MAQMDFLRAKAMAQVDFLRAKADVTPRTQPNTV
jgi:hypothetical protein